MTSAHGNLATVRAIWKGDVAPTAKRGICLFASFDGDSHLAEATVQYLAALEQEGYAIFFVTTSAALSAADRARLTPLCSQIVHRENRGYDFYSWKTGLALARRLVPGKMPLLFTNDSILGPVHPLAPAFAKIRAMPETVWGLTDSNETGHWHLQSYFLHVSASRSSEAWFKTFWDDVRIEHEKHTIIQNYEIGFTAAALAVGVPCAAVYPTEQVIPKAQAMGYEFQYRSRLTAAGEINTTLFMWDILLREHAFPFIKAELLRQDRFQSQALANWPALLPAASPETIRALQEVEERALWRSHHVSKRFGRLHGWIRRHTEERPATKLFLMSVLHHLRLTRRLGQSLLIRDWVTARSIARQELAAWRTHRRGKALAAKSAPELLQVDKERRREDYFAEARRQLDTFLFSGQMLDLSPLGTVRLTIVIILYNKAELTYRCLRSLAALRGEVPFEVLIIDNDSRDASALLSSRLRGAKVVQNAQNVGFLKACNQARDLARGELVLFLNNDTEVHPGSLAVASAAFSRDDKLGAIGGRIILPHGNLQEAGNIIWNDGTCVGYARERPAQAPEAMFQRQVDYCSGAFLMTRTDLFQKLSGFDLDFAPAYYEETDYAIRLQKAGYSVLYDPRIAITHVEFGSAELSADAFQLMHRNRATLQRKHGDYLATRYPPEPHRHILSARTSTSSQAKRLLIVDDRIPNASLGAGYPRANKIVHLLGKMGYEITIVCRENYAFDWHSVYHDIGRNVEVLPIVDAEVFFAFLRERASYYDVVWVSRPGNMRAFDAYLRSEEKRRDYFLIYDSEAFFAERGLIEAEVFGEDTGPAQRELQREIRAAQDVDLIIAVSARDGAKWRQSTQKPTIIVGHDAVAKPTPKSFAERCDILFVGTLYGLESPNGDSLCWFMREVMPHLRAHWGGRVGLHAAGYVEPSLAKRLGRASLRNFHLVGPYHDAAGLFDRYRIVVIPTRFAAGIAQKAFDSAVYGVPSVCSSLIASQLGWTDGKECLAAPVSDPEAFARSCIRLYEEEALWTSVRQEAFAYLAAYDRQESIEAGMKQLAQQLDSRPTSRLVSPLTSGVASVRTQVAPAAK